MTEKDATPVSGKLSDGLLKSIQKIAEDTKVLHQRNDRLAEQVKIVEEHLVGLKVGERLSLDDLEMKIQGLEPYTAVGFFCGRFKVDSVVKRWTPWAELGASDKAATFQYLEPLVAIIAEKFHRFVTLTQPK